MRILNIINRLKTKIIILFLQRITINRILIKLLKKTECHDKNYFKLIKRGHVISGYIPFIPHKTSIIIYNFLAANYGIRSDLKIVIGILDSKFQVLSSKIYNLPIREIFVLSQEHFADEFKNINGQFCIASVLNQKIPINHAGHGGQLRFWGVWENFSSFSHSMPLPSPVSFLRSKFNKLKNEYFERMIYPLGSSTAFHFGPFSEKIHIKERGDLSGMRKVQFGYTVLLDSNKKVTSCFHNSIFNRDKKLSNSNIEFIKHIVPIPPLPGIDIEMFFGECSSKESLFEAKLLEYDYSRDTKTCIEKVILDLREIDSIKASEIFNKKISNNNERWIAFKPKSGLHCRENLSTFFISPFYPNEKQKILFDCTQAATISHNPYIAKTNKGALRSLKFAPFILNHKNTFKNKEVMISFLSVIGDEQKDVNVRIRIFSNNSKNFELIHQKKIKKSCVHHINLNQLLDKNVKKGLKGVFICQLESEEANLDSYLIHSNVDSNFKKTSSLAIDHLTGG